MGEDGYLSNATMIMPSTRVTSRKEMVQTLILVSDSNHRSSRGRCLQRRCRGGGQTATRKRPESTTQQPGLETSGRDRRQQRQQRPRRGDVDRKRAEGARGERDREWEESAGAGDCVFQYPA
jgi:hypothetical protein